MNKFLSMMVEWYRYSDNRKKVANFCSYIFRGSLAKLYATKYKLRSRTKDYISMLVWNYKRNAIIAEQLSITESSSNNLQRGKDFLLDSAHENYNHKTKDEEDNEEGFHAAQIGSEDKFHYFYSNFVTLLKIEKKFIAMLEILPDYARVIDDRLYRAVDIYLKNRVGLDSDLLVRLADVVQIEMASVFEHHLK
ncbi:hypothetical protein L1049_001562 [Liquidambar formosana]|uniref:Uncharacterized protein n=1 Tax=Liquidambar formosana TaxID=63359 RepID=A0AAP0NEG9_LIQFO